MKDSVRSPGNDRKRVYVRSLPVRLTHWIIFLCVPILAATGLYIAHPYLLAAETEDPFVRGTVEYIHVYTACIFDVAFAAELMMILVGGRYERLGQYIPLTRKRWRSVFESLKFYLFLRRTPPMTVSHDGLDGFVFVIVFLIEIVIILTGFALWANQTSYDSPLSYLGFLVPVFGGLQIARWIHHIMMWVMIAWIVQHVIRAIMLSVIKKDATMDSIFSGYKYISPEKVAEFEDTAVLDERN